MESWNEEPKNRYKVNTRPIVSLLIGLGFLSAILLATMLAASDSGSKKSPVTDSKKQDVNNTTQAAATGNQLLAVVKEIDTQNKQITLYDVNRQEAVVFSYNGGTDLADKYGKKITINQVAIGSMVDAFYEQDKNRLLSMNTSKVAWEYPDVKNMSISSKDKIIKIASTKYRYTEDILILDGKEVIPVEDLTEQDTVTVWGKEETIWSIVVTRGHGTVILQDYEDFIGNYITIGYESMQQITEDTAIAVREGTFNLTVENGLYSATKIVTVKRNEVTYVSLSDLSSKGLKEGEITFEITPVGADLYIDKKLTTYGDPIALSYGEHSVVAMLGGYTTYEGILEVDSKSKVIKINLPEAESSEEAVATETDTSPDTGSDTDTSGVITDNKSDDDKDIDSTPSDSTNTDTSSESTNTKPDKITDKTHKIYVKEPSGASVYLDGDYVGTAPCEFKKVIGSHVLTFIQDGYETMSYTVEIANDGTNPTLVFQSLKKSE